MAKLLTTVDFSNGDQVTSAKLDEIIGGASFDSDAVVGTTLAVVGGQLKVRVITSAEMGALSIATGSIQDSAVTTAKIADGGVTTVKLGNLSVTAAKIATGTITLTQLSTTIIAARADVESITSGKLVDSEVVGYAPGCAKSYGGFAISSSSRTVRPNSFNFGSVTRLSSTQTQVTFSAAMVGANYVPLAALETDGTETGEVAVYDRQGNGFKIRHPAESSGRAISFVVFGKLN